MLALVVAYDMYKERITENLAMEAFGIGSGDIIKALDFHDFYERCAEIGMAYKPGKQEYLRNQFIQNVTGLTYKRQVMLQDSVDRDIFIRLAGWSKETQQLLEVLVIDVF